jgi:hypothetical protein
VTTQDLSMARQEALTIEQNPGVGTKGAPNSREGGRALVVQTELGSNPTILGSHF